MKRQVKGHIWEVWGQLWDQFDGNFKAQAGYKAWSPLMSQVWDQIMGQVVYRLKCQAENQLNGQAFKWAIKSK